jgi:hypothetical protein
MDLIPIHDIIAFTIYFFTLQEFGPHVDTEFVSHI